MQDNDNVRPYFKVSCRYCCQLIICVWNNVLYAIQYVTSMGQLQWISVDNFIPFNGMSWIIQTTWTGWNCSHSLKTSFVAYLPTNLSTSRSNLTESGIYNALTIIPLPMAIRYLEPTLTLPVWYCMYICKSSPITPGSSVDVQSLYY